MSSGCSVSLPTLRRLGYHESRVLFLEEQISLLFLALLYLALSRLFLLSRERPL